MRETQLQLSKSDKGQWLDTTLMFLHLSFEATTCCCGPLW